MARVAPLDWRPPNGVILDPLTLAAVTSDKSAAIVAGPGAGKTELLAQRASFLLETNTCAAPRRILAISFKRDAAKNLRDRVALRVGDDLAGRLESYTFDAFAKSLVDRFGSTLPPWCRPDREYDIAMPRWQDWSEFALRLQADHNISSSAQALNLGHATLTAEPGPLPIAAQQKDFPNQAGLRWWSEMLRKRKPSQLTFGMIATLAMTVLEHNPQILAALRLTYSHVFLDEFQDTTGLQYALLKRAFLGSSTVMTAVGDSKQRIMTFAGARSGIFEEFSQDFGADVVALTTNFRSNRRIVDIVNAMAQKIEPDAVLVASARADVDLPEVTDAVLHYDRTAEEAVDLADIIATAVRDGENRPEDFMLLVRQNADTVEAALAPAFIAQGLTLRNEARSLGGVAIQELMTEPLADLVIGVVQMAIDDRFNAPFQRVRNMIGPVFGNDDDRPSAEIRVERAIRDAVRVAREAVAVAPAQADIEALVQAILAVFDDRLLRQLAPDYAKAARIPEIQKATVKLLAECAEGVETWPDAVGQFLGRAQVKLLTVHKSKGLEAHTVFFLHLQDDGFFWKADMEEEALAFFVAASRARERFFVTTTDSQRTRVAPLWEMVAAAELPEIHRPASTT